MTAEVDIDEVREYLRIVHTDDDTLLLTLIEASEVEAKRFMGRRQLPTMPLDYPQDSEGILLSEDVPDSDTDPIASDVRAAIYLLVQSKYEGTKPADIALLRSAAESMLMPYRLGMGV